MKAPFAYYGGKAGMAERIIEVMPPHKVYIEPFFGSGAVFFAKPKTPVEIVNDIDDTLIAFLTALRDHLEELEAACSLTPHSRTEYLSARGAESSDDLIETARLFWVRVNQSFAKTASGNTGWSVTTARNQSIPGSIRSRLGRFAACADRLSQTTIENRAAVDLIDSLATPETVIYADPPYLPSTRVGRKNKPRDYTHEMTEDDHRRLAESLNRTPAAVILSGYDSPLYADLYSDWRRIEFAVTSFSSNARTVARGGRTEVLWLNYEPSRVEQMMLIPNASYDEEEVDG